MNIKTKRICSLALAALLTASVGACSQGSATRDTNVTTTTAPATTTTTATLKEEQAEVVDKIEIEGAEKLANGKVQWLSFWDINPGEGKAAPTELELFANNYGGYIELIPCTWDDRFDKLGMLVAAGDSPDLFPAADLDVFPRCASMFEALDSYIDLSDPLWDDVREMNDMYTINGKHYVANLGTELGVIMVYNKKTIEENSLPDPAQLLAEDNWTWDTLNDMMIQFCDRENGKFAIDGWWFESAISLTTGVPYISFKDGVVSSNLSDPLIFKAQEFMENMNKQDLPYPKAEHSWEVNEGNIGLGKTLFYPVGIWKLYEGDLSAFGEMEDIMFVPMPRCPDADAYYLPTGVDAMAMVSGGKNPEGAAAFLKCRRTANTMPETLAIQKQQFAEEYGWTQDMLDMYDTTKKLTAEHPMFEFLGAVTPTLNDLLLNPMKESFNSGKSWSQTRDEYTFMIDAEIATANENLAKKEAE